MSKKEEMNRQRNEFLLTFFPEAGRYMVVQVNGWTLVQQKNSNGWGVAIWRPGVYEKSQEVYQSIKQSKTKSNWELRLPGTDKNGVIHHQV